MLAELAAFEATQVLEDALLKVIMRNKCSRVDQWAAFSPEEQEALSLWLNMQLDLPVKETRAQRSIRRRAAWRSGDRREWGGEHRRRDPRRGWRNFYERG